MTNRGGSSNDCGRPFVAILAMLTTMFFLVVSVAGAADQPQVKKSIGRPEMYSPFCPFFSTMRNPRLVSATSMRPSGRKLNPQGLKSPSTAVWVS